MKLLRWLCPLLFVSVLLVSARAARAQSAPSVTGILGSVQRCESPGSGSCTSADAPGEDPHPSGVTTNTINLEDCTANLFYQFDLGVADPSASYVLEAWAGTQDCSQLANRQSASSAVCWPVAPFQLALTNPYLFNVRMQDIASGASAATHPVTYAPTTDPTVCHAQTQTGATALTLYFFFADGGSNPVGTVQQYPIALDTRAGDVQGNISVLGASSALIVNIAATSDPSTQGWNVYCDPPPANGSSEAGDASLSDAAASSPGACAPSSVLIQGAAAPLDPRYLCAQTGATSTTVDVSGLINGQHYNVAVAATDAAGNVGPLSNVVCGEPTESSTEVSGGGVSCSASRLSPPAGTSGLGGFLAASIVGLVRKRKRSRRPE
jgi:hypothetical protein